MCLADFLSLRREFSPLSKEQLVELLARASLKHEDVCNQTRNLIETSPACRRLMLRNISFSTDDSSLKEFMEQFGEIDDATIVREKDSTSRGYGFVTFKDTAASKKALNCTMRLEGRLVMAKLAADPFSDFSSGETQNSGRRKLFVRNLSDHTTSEDLEEVFKQHGPLAECAVATDAFGKSRGFGFILFKEAESAVQAVQQPQRIIRDRVTFVSFASSTKIAKRP